MDSGPIRYDFTNGYEFLCHETLPVSNPLNRPQSAEQIHSWISRHLQDRPHPPISRPINWVRVIAITTTLLATVTFLGVAWPYILPVVQNRNVWAAISLIAILLFTSGHMFNHIRKVAYVAGDGKQLFPCTFGLRRVRGTSHKQPEPLTTCTPTFFNKPRLTLL